MLEEDLSLWQKAHPAGRSLEEYCTKLVFESANLPAHGRLRDVDTLCGSSDVALLGDGHEIANLGKAHIQTISTLARGAEIKEVLDGALRISNARPP